MARPRQHLLSALVSRASSFYHVKQDSTIDADICKGSESPRVWARARTLGQPSDLPPKDSTFSVSVSGAPVF